jgi:hypothetical protein
MNDAMETVQPGPLAHGLLSHRATKDCQNLWTTKAKTTRRSL